MPVFFNEDALTPEQRARYAWAVAEYARIQEENRRRFERAGKSQHPHQISPKSALFARLLEGKEPLPYPPPTSHSYPWYDIIETPGKYHVTIGGCLSAQDEEHILLNQCPWTVVRKNEGASAFLKFLRQAPEPAKASVEMQKELQKALAQKPEFVLSYGAWSGFRLYMGRVIRHGRRASVVNSKFDLHTLDGGNPVIVKVLRSGAEIRAKADATLADVMARLEQSEYDLSPFDRITLASESGISRSDQPEGDDLVEYDCDGWVLEKI
jgi:hypothetical protein